MSVDRAKVRVATKGIDRIELTIDGENVGAVVQHENGNVTIEVIRGYLTNGRKVNVLLRSPSERRSPPSVKETYEDELRARGVI